MTPLKTTIRIDTIIECLLHWKRQEKYTAIYYNIHDNKCNVNILYLVSQSSNNYDWICYRFEGMYIMCHYVTVTWGCRIVRNDMDVNQQDRLQRYTEIQIKLKEQLVVRNDMNVNEQGRLSNITLIYKLK